MGRATRGCRRWGVLAVAVAGAALLAAACGGGSPPAPAALTAYQKALAYAQCMRARGVAGWPAAVRCAAAMIACALFSMSWPVVAHPEMLIRMAGLPFHRVGPHQQVPSR